MQQSHGHLHWHSNRTKVGAPCATGLWHGIHWQCQREECQQKQHGAASTIVEKRYTQAITYGIIEGDSVQDPPQMMRGMNRAQSRRALPNDANPLEQYTPRTDSNAWNARLAANTNSQRKHRAETLPIVAKTFGTDGELAALLASPWNGAGRAPVGLGFFFVLRPIERAARSCHTQRSVQDLSWRTKRKWLTHWSIDRSNHSWCLDTRMSAQP